MCSVGSAGSVGLPCGMNPFCMNTKPLLHQSFGRTDELGVVICLMRYAQTIPWISIWYL